MNAQQANEANKQSYLKHKDNVFTLRIYDEQKAVLEAQSELTGLSKAALIRATIENVTIKPKNDKFDKLVLRELNAIGNNLNQLARIANESALAGLLNKDSLILKLDEIKSELVIIREKL